MRTMRNEHIEGHESFYSEIKKHQKLYCQLELSRFYGFQGILNRKILFPYA